MSSCFLNYQYFFKKDQVLSLSTGIFIAVALMGIFFVSPVFSADSLNPASINSDSITSDSATSETSALESATSDSSASNSSISNSSTTGSLLNPKNPSAGPDVTSSILKVTGGLLLVIMAIFGSAWFYRRFGNFSPVANDSLKVIGGLTIGQKEKIILLQVGEEQVLVGVAPGNIQKLHVLQTPIKLNDELEKQNKGFSDQLSEALGKWKK